MQSSGGTSIMKLAIFLDKEGIVHRVKVLKSADGKFDEAAKFALLSTTLSQQNWAIKP